MMHGPFPLPEQDSNPTSAQWVMDASHGNPELYQLRMLEEALRTDHAHRDMDPIDFENNQIRLNTEIKAATVRHFGTIAREGIYRAKAGRGNRQSVIR